jgi:hypothetical protein
LEAKKGGRTKRKKKLKKNLVPKNVVGFGFDPLVTVLKRIPHSLSALTTPI